MIEFRNIYDERFLVRPRNIAALLPDGNVTVLELDGGQHLVVNAPLDAVDAAIQAYYEALEAA